MDRELLEHTCVVGEVGAANNIAQTSSKGAIVNFSPLGAIIISISSMIAIATNAPAHINGIRWTDLLYFMPQENHNLRIVNTNRCGQWSFHETLNTY